MYRAIFNRVTDSLLHTYQVFEGLPVTYNELFVDGLAKPDEAVANLAYQPAQKSFKVAIECPVVGL
jgi:hypothetical protein